MQDPKMIAAKKFQKSMARRSVFGVGGEEGYQLRLINTLMKPPTERSKPEIDYLFKLTMQQLSTDKNNFFMKFMADHGEQNLKKLLRSCYYE